MPLYFFETSAVVKRYHKEIGTEKVLEILSNEKNDIIIAHITMAEVISAFKRKMNRKEITNEVFVEIADRFLYDVENRFAFRRLEDNHVANAINLITTHGLRAGDAIQLGTALELKQDYIFVSADKRQLAAARSEGLKVLNPEEN